MKKMMVAACAMVAAFAWVADGATRSPRLLGFALGDKVDAAVCKARGFYSECQRRGRVRAQEAGAYREVQGGVCRVRMRQGQGY